MENASCEKLKCALLFNPVLYHLYSPLSPYIIIYYFCCAGIFLRWRLATFTYSAFPFCYFIIELVITLMLFWKTIKVCILSQLASF